MSLHFLAKRMYLLLLDQNFGLKNLCIVVSSFRVILLFFSVVEKIGEKRSSYSSSKGKVWIAEFARTTEDRTYLQADFSNFSSMIERLKWSHLEIVCHWYFNLKVKLSINVTVCEVPKQVSARSMLIYHHQTSSVDGGVKLFYSYIFADVLCTITMPIFNKNIYFIAFSNSYFSVPTILLSTLLVLWECSFSG